MGRGPCVGEQLPKVISRVGRQPLQNILQVGERVGPEQLAAAHKAMQRRRRLATSVTADEQIVVPFEGFRSSDRQNLGIDQLDSRVFVARLVPWSDHGACSYVWPKGGFLAQSVRLAERLPCSAERACLDVYCLITR